MPNRAKRAAARQSQLGQRRRKERKERVSPQTEQVVINKAYPEALIPELPSDIDNAQSATQKVSATATAGTTMPSQPYLRADLTRVAMVAALSTVIVIGSAVIL